MPKSIGQIFPSCVEGESESNIAYRPFGPCRITKSAIDHSKGSQMISLRGGMVNDNTRTPSSSSVDVNEETRPASRSSTLNSDDVPDPDLTMDTANGQAVQPPLSRRVTPVIFVNDTGNSNLILPEPDQIHLPRSIAEEDLLRASGTVATATTPVLGPAQGLCQSDTNIAEYVDQHFNLDPDEAHDNDADRFGGPSVLFREPNYTQSDGAQDIAVLDDDGDDGVAPSHARRISDALRTTRSRIREFFPATDIVTSNRTSTLNPSTSRRPRASITTRQALEEQTMVQRAINRIVPRRQSDPSPPVDDGPSDNQAPSPREEGARLVSHQTQQVPLPIESIPVPSNADLGITFDEQRWQPADQVQQEDFAQGHNSTQLTAAETDQAVNRGLNHDAEFNRQARSPSIVQRALRRISTFTLRTRWGSAETTIAPPPTREGPSDSRTHSRAETHTGQSRQEPRSRTATIRARLRRIGSSSVNLARRSIPRFGANVAPEGPQVGDDTGHKTQSVGHSQGRTRNRTRRHQVFPEWRDPIRRTRAAMQRGSTPPGHGRAEVVEENIAEASAPNNGRHEERRMTLTQTIITKVRTIRKIEQRVIPI